MKYKIDVRKFGDSFYIRVDKFVRNKLQIKENDWVEVDINKITNLLTIKCPICHNVFNTEESNIYDCPFCDSSSLQHEVEVIENE